MVKICLVNPLPEKHAYQLIQYGEEISAKVLRSDTKVGFKSPRGAVGLTGGGSRYLSVLNDMEIVEKIIEAEREGYDAVVVHCFLDPGVRLARSAVSIPVIGPGESTMALALSYGSRFGVVTMPNPDVVKVIENRVREYGLQDRAVEPVRPISIPLGIWARMGKEEASEKDLPNIMDRARECVADGADVIVMGCTMVGPLCTFAGISKVPDIDADVPILDCLSVALKTAENVLDFNAMMGLPPIGRTGIYAKAPEKAFSRTREAVGLKTY